MSSEPTPTYDEALDAYRRAAQAGDFPAALAACVASPPHPPREIAPDGTLEWDYFLSREIDWHSHTVEGFPEHGIAAVPPIWTPEQAAQLRAALKPLPPTHEQIQQAMWDEWSARRKSGGFRDESHFGVPERKEQELRFL